MSPRLSPTARPPSWLLGDAELRYTLIISAVTVGVAVGLWRNARPDQQVPPQSWPSGAPAPRLSVIVPLRNEAANVAGCIGGLLAQRYPNFEVVAVDDQSTDGTGAALTRRAAGDARLRVVPGAPLPPGWTGKNWAIQQGLAAAGLQAEWILTLDADMRLEPDALAAALLYARQVGADMLTLLPRLELGSFWEKVLVPHAGELYSLLVGVMSQVNDPGSPVASANGQFILLRRSVYEAVGGQAAVRGDVAEDWALAHRVKGAGYRLVMAQGPAILRARVYAGLGDLWAGFSKTLFPAAGRSLPRVALTILALTGYGVVPPVRLALAALALRHDGRRDARRVRLGLIQVVPMLLLRGALARYLGLPPGYALAYPLAILLGDGMLLWSAWRYLSGRGLAWKGRTYD
ncbi:MAG TPA: glycosyltransferase [Chloroflexia bacterium]|nr:glycosyltransferase [Chloroflexia bacterium]